MEMGDFSATDYKVLTKFGPLNSKKIQKKRKKERGCCRSIDYALGLCRIDFSKFKIMKACKESEGQSIDSATPIFLGYELEASSGTWDDEDEDPDWEMPKDKESYYKYCLYLKQAEESEGFDIDYYPGTTPGLARLAPVKASRELYPDEYANYKNLAELAMKAYKNYPDDDDDDENDDDDDNVELELDLFYILITS